MTEAAIKGKVDNLIGLKENVIIGKLIPVGTGMKRYRSTRLNTDEEAAAAEEVIRSGEKSVGASVKKGRIGAETDEEADLDLSDDIDLDEIDDDMADGMDQDDIDDEMADDIDDLDDENPEDMQDFEEDEDSEEDALETVAAGDIIE